MSLNPMTSVLKVNRPFLSASSFLSATGKCLSPKSLLSNCQLLKTILSEMYQWSDMLYRQLSGFLWVVGSEQAKQNGVDWDGPAGDELISGGSRST